MATTVDKLTQFSPGAGCGCKISPKDLSQILKECSSNFYDPNLLVGNSSNDDAAIVDLGDGRGIISTTDFFTPIVDNPRNYGKISATNALSDIYAMGGTPLMAIAILSWPLDKLGPHLAAEVMGGAEEVCHSAGIALAGGHSISGSEPIFGLAVTGIVNINEIKRNGSATAGSQLYITKPLGIGLVTTAEKFELARE
ncbi:MAG: selenide, water dikinase SelD, partial [Bacteroidales bacterium]